MRGDPGMIWHETADIETPPPLLGPPHDGDPGGAVLWRLLLRVLQGHPVTPSLPHHFQHSSGCHHMELGGASRRVGDRPRWFQMGSPVACVILLSRRRSLGFPATGLPLGGPVLTYSPLLQGGPLHQCQ